MFISFHTGLESLDFPPRPVRVPLLCERFNAKIRAAHLRPARRDHEVATTGIPIYAARCFVGLFLRGARQMGEVAWGPSRFSTRQPIGL